MLKLNINEIFYSLQGEGSRAGSANIFIRLAGCNKDCWFCDTDWLKGTEHPLNEVLNIISEYKCKNIIWTGGEPSLQLTDEIIKYFKDNGYYQAIETNGSMILPDGIDYITCSPKVATNELKRNFPNGVDEFRYPLSKDMILPDINKLPEAKHYYISPIFLGEIKKRFQLNDENLNYCINYIKENPTWKLSLQQHKIWNIR